MEKLLKKEGFTLMETLVAMMIMAVCLVVIFELFSGGLKAADVSKDYTTAVFHAREVMDDILLRDSLGDEEKEGVFEDGYRWKATIALIKDEEKKKRRPDVFQIRVDVFWGPEKKESRFGVSSLKIATRLENDAS